MSVARTVMFDSEKSHEPSEVRGYHISHRLPLGPGSGILTSQHPSYSPVWTADGLKGRET